jgi:hypothetical protein
MDLDHEGTSISDLQPDTNYHCVEQGLTFDLVIYVKLVHDSKHCFTGNMPPLPQYKISLTRHFSQAMKAVQ